MIMMSRNGLHKLAICNFLNHSKIYLELKHQNWPGNGSLKKENWQPEKGLVTSPRPILIFIMFMQREWVENKKEVRFCRFLIILFQNILLRLLQKQNAS